MRLAAEFTTEPFVGEGTPPPHATETLRIVETAGLTCVFGPLGTSIAGEDDELLPVLGRVLATALAHGATRVSLQVERVDG
ncbi:thiamine-binding protein [Modestobacter marinus]|uniref:thiamine-binding protein n=1 Tax=Modestobacter marinus TaxID=477641 RepID=UPI001C98E0CF|nr:thiamine-binding protein [Modestobacter marinus]